MLLVKVWIVLLLLALLILPLPILSLIPRLRLRRILNILSPLPVDLCSRMRLIPVLLTRRLLLIAPIAVGALRCLRKLSWNVHLWTRLGILSDLVLVPLRLSLSMMLTLRDRVLNHLTADTLFDRLLLLFSGFDCTNQTAPLNCWPWIFAGHIYQR